MKTVLRYEAKMVSKLFQWQIDCLCVENGKVLRGGNLVYSAPTSGGKTLVAEILMLRRIGLKSGTIFFVVPFIALAEEKAEYFREMWADMFIGVRVFHGEDGGGELTPDVDIAVCTIERANILLNTLLDERRTHQLSMVVVDEIHMLSDPHRGYLLEVTLSKIKYLLGRSVQCVGMSATLPNLADLAAWLDASLYSTEYRPVALTVQLCIDRSLFQVDQRADRFGAIGAQERAALQLDRPVLPSHAGHNLRTTFCDTDGVLGLCLETILQQKSVLVFCNSKDLCQKNALRVAKMLSAVVSAAPEAMAPAAQRVRTARLEVLQQLQQSAVGLCPVLQQTVREGVAYHHSGLTAEERRLVEGAFREGTLRCLCATSTLAAGVNLPAHRVIIRSAYMGPKELSVASFRQMCGRAGRMGLDSLGEAVLIVPAKNRVQLELATRLVTAEIEPLHSCLHCGPDSGVRPQGAPAAVPTAVSTPVGLVKLLLEMVCCGGLSQEERVADFVSCTLMASQHASQVEELAAAAVSYLFQHKFLLATSQRALVASPLGLATALSGISPPDALLLLPALTVARHRFVAKSGFHAVFLCTPPSSAVQPVWPDFEVVVNAFYKDHPDVEPVAEMLGINRGELLSLSNRPPPFGCCSPKTLLYKRFYSAIILFRLIQEQPLNAVSRIMRVERGQGQALQKDAAMFCHMTIQFCNKLNWRYLACCLDSLSGRLNYGVSEELLPLVRIGPEVPSVRARALVRSGLKTPLLVATAGPEAVAAVIFASLPFDSRDPLAVGKDLEGSEEDRRRVLHSCLRLATRIVGRARMYLVEEMSIQQAGDR